MKKFSVLFSLLVLTALVLSACGGADNNTSTPGAVVDTTPTLDDGMGAATETMAAPLEPTATVAMEATPAGDLTTTPEGTPQAGAPVTEGQCVANRVDNLLDFEVLDSAGTKVGDVEGVLVQRNVAFVVDEDALEANATPAATPAAGDAAAAAGPAPRIQYVVVDLENNDDDVLVPLAAFDLSVGEEASPDSCNLNVSVDSAVLAGAPVFKADDLALNVPGWDEAFTAYWSGQNLTIPATGPELSGVPALIDDEVSDVPLRNYTGDDLGEAEDFIFDFETGDLTYAILASGGFLGLGEKHIPVPVNRLQWAYEEAEDANEVDELGYLLINVDEAAWENAPAFDSLDELDTTVAGWDDEIVAFWNSLTD